MADSLGMAFCVFDFVTNLDFSQKLAVQYGCTETALFVGAQCRELQARLSHLGLGEDPEHMDRYSILYGVLPKTEHPFGRSIVLPASLGDLMGYLLEPLKLTWTPTPRFELLPKNGSYHSAQEPQQQSVYYQLESPGRRAVEQIIASWQYLLRQGYQYGAVDVPIGAPGLAQVHDLLAEHGFFVSGFVPIRNREGLYFRLQATGHAEVAFDQIKMFSPQAKRLLDTVRSDYERNRLI
jgi:hypothetical protein